MRELIAQRWAVALRVCAEKRGERVDEMAAVLQVSRSTIFKMLASDPTAKVDPEMLRIMTEQTGVALGWLVGFDIPMYGEARAELEESGNTDLRLDAIPA